MNEVSDLTAKLVCNKDEVCYRTDVHYTDYSDSTYGMGRGCDITIWLCIPKQPNYGLGVIWNRLDRDTSPLERYRFVCQRVKEKACLTK